MEAQQLHIETERELDGQWIASAPDERGEPSVYGATRIEAVRNLLDMLEEVWE